MATDCDAPQGETMSNSWKLGSNRSLAYVLLALVLFGNTLIFGNLWVSMICSPVKVMS